MQIKNAFADYLSAKRDALTLAETPNSERNELWAVSSLSYGARSVMYESFIEWMNDQMEKSCDAVKRRDRSKNILNE